MFDVTDTVGIKNSRIHHLNKAGALSFLHPFHSVGVPLLGRLFGDDPVVCFGASDAKSRRQQVFLADGERLDIDQLVLEVFKTGFLVGPFGLDGQAKQAGDGTTNLSGVSQLV